MNPGPATRPCRAGPAHVVTVLAGLREPIVVILLLIAFFTWISGKPLDGLLMLVVGVSLAWDTGRRRRQGGAPEGRLAGDSASGFGAANQDDARGEGQATRLDAPPAAARWRRRLVVLAWLAGGALYAALVGSFSRYSWPATVPVAVLGAAVVVAGWRGPRHSRPAPAKLPATGLALWGVVLVEGCLWELSSLFQQPTMTTDSYAHPTISTLTDPVLGTWAGRSIFLAAWLGLGWFLVERGTVTTSPASATWWCCSPGSSCSCSPPGPALPSLRWGRFSRGRWAPGPAGSVCSSPGPGWGCISSPVEQPGTNAVLTDSIGLLTGGMSVPAISGMARQRAGSYRAVILRSLQRRAT